MLPEEKVAILAQIRFAVENADNIMNMVKGESNCKQILLALVVLNETLRATERDLFFSQLQRSIETFRLNPCHEIQSAEVEQLVRLFSIHRNYS